MSFNLYLQRFRNGLLAEIPTAQLVAHFAPHIARREHWGIMLLYPDGGGGELYVDGETFHSFTIARPGGEALFDDLFALMRLAGLVLYWPSETPSLTIADQALATHVMAGVVEAVGPAMPVSCGGDIITAIRRR